MVVINHSLPLYLGPAAVYIFFMLSGYWFVRMWRTEYAPLRHPYRVFLVSRLWRLLPVYYVTLLLFFLCNHFFPATPGLVYLPAGWGGVHLFLSHLFILGYATLPFLQKLVLPVWSLDIEIQFYLLAPLLIWFLTSVSLPRLRLGILAAAGAVGLIVFFHSYATLDDQSAAWLPMYLLFFLIGLFTARFDWRPTPSWAWGGLAMAGAAVAVSLVLPVTRSILLCKVGGWTVAYNPHANLVLALLCAPYAMATVWQAPTGRSWLGRIDRDLGNITYEVYLLHWPVMSVLKHFTGRVHTLRQLPALLLAWLALAPLSWLVYRWIDRPLDRARRAFVRSAVRSTIAAVPAEHLDIQEKETVPLRRPLS